MSPIFCTFALAEEHFNYLWNYVILKLKASVAPNLRPAISLTFCHRQPGRNFADFLPQTPIWRPWRSWKRRSFLPVEVNKIYQALGQP